MHVLHKHRTDLPNARVQALVKLDRGALAPKILPEFLAGNQFPRTGNKQQQEPERLRLELYLHSGLEQLTRPWVEFERAKT